MLQQQYDTKTTIVPSVQIRNRSLRKGRSWAQGHTVGCIRGFRLIMASPGAFWIDREKIPEPWRSRGGRGGQQRGGQGARRGLFPSEAFPSPPDYLYNQPFLPNRIKSAPIREVQGSLAMKHAIFHFPNVFCFSWEDVFGITLHPVRTKRSH